jgi:IS30 family transposase
MVVGKDKPTFHASHHHDFIIEERRMKLAPMLAQSMTETEIAEQLNVDQSTISRDVKALKEMSKQFVFDLAKSDLSYYYKQAKDGIEEAKKEAWDNLIAHDLL